MESQPKNPEFRNNPENFHPQVMEWVSSKCTDVPAHLSSFKKAFARLCI